MTVTESVADIQLTTNAGIEAPMLGPLCQRDQPRQYRPTKSASKRLIKAARGQNCSIRIGVETQLA